MKELAGTESTLKRHIKREEALKSIGGGKEVAQKTVEKTDKKEEPWEEKFKKRILKDIHIQKAASMISLITLAKKHSPHKVDTRKKAVAFLKKSLLSDDTIGIKKIG